MSEDKEENMEDKILQIAEEQFLKKGFAMTSLAEIAKLAGCNHALLHYYFRTKEKLFTRIFFEKSKLFVSILNADDNSNDDFLTKIRHKVERYFDLLEANQNIPFLFINEMLTNPSRLMFIHENTNIELMKTQILPNFEKEIEQAVQRGEIRPITPLNLLLDIIALCAFTMLSLPILQEVLQIDENDKKAILAQRKTDIVENILRYLRP